MKKGLLLVSIVTLGCLYGLLVAVVILICSLTGASTLVAVIAAIAALGVQFLVGPWLTDLSMRWFYKADFNAQLPAYLTEFVREVSEKHNMKMPRLGLIRDGAPNAFTYGRTKNDARIVLTEGTLNLLTEEDVKAVVAHELGHAVHYDMLVMTVAQVVPLILYALYEACMEIMKNDSKSSSGNSDSKGKGAIGLIGIIAFVLYLICQLIILWLSRTREYYADEFSVKETENPNALADALVRIGYGLSTTGKAETNNRHAVSSPTTLGISDAGSSKAMAVCCTPDNGTDVRAGIRNAMKWDMWNVWAKIYELGSTHPLISKRLLNISAYSAQYGQEPYITFDLKKPESYVDDFAREILLYIAPAMMLIAGIVLSIFLHGNPLYFVLGLTFCFALSILKYMYTHPGRNFRRESVRSLLGEVKVSGITCIPCEMEGEIIGRGNPGCIFNEDFVIRDETGIVLLDYKQPLFIINKLFAMFKSKEYFGRVIKVTGWYRRSPVPYVEVKTMEVDGKVKRCWTYQFGYIWRGILLAVCLFFLIVSFI